MYSFSNVLSRHLPGFSKPRVFEIDDEKFENVQQALGVDDKNSPFIRKELNEFILTFKKTETGWKVIIISK